MSDKKMSLREAFDEVFGKEDKYFGEWFIKADESLTDFFKNNPSSKEIFFRQLRYLYLYLESLEILKKQAINKDGAIANVVSKETWYCCVLLLLIGLIDQHTKNELRPNGKIKRQKDRFKAVMDSLTEEKKRDMLNHYGGDKKYNNFDDVISHIYATRNFFAHEIVLPDGAIPQDGLLAFNDKKLNTMYLNMPHGRIFLIIVIALIRYFGFVGKIEVASNKKFVSWSNMFRYS
ncbi:MAG: hypothetical protein Q7K35_05385 [bacterium]|nr:hypothetical protein [bacterium]